MPQRAPKAIVEMIREERADRPKRAMPVLPNLKRSSMIAAMAVALSLGACGGFDGVELNGGVFDALGVGSNSQKVTEPKLAPRAGLILPPNADRLPQPGSESQQITTATIADPAWPKDTDETRRNKQAAIQAQHDEFCRKELERKKVYADPRSTTGPLGPCDPSAFRAAGTKSPLSGLQGDQPSGLPK